MRFKNEIGWSAADEEYLAAGLSMQTVPHVPAAAPYRIDTDTYGT